MQDNLSYFNEGVTAHRAAPFADSPTSVNKEKTLDYLSISAPIAEARDNQEFISAAKLQNNSETTKDLAKKNCPKIQLQNATRSAKVRKKSEPVP